MLTNPIGCVQLCTALFGSPKVSSVSSSLIEHNSAQNNSGGGIYLDMFASLYIESSTFLNNSAYFHGAGLAATNSILSVSRSQFSRNNLQMKHGGALYISGDNSNTILTDNNFDHNFAGSNGNGGAIYITKASTVFSSRDRYSANEAKSGNGGAVYMEDGVKFDCSNCLLQENVAFLNGGALSTDSWGLSLSNMTRIRNNVAILGRGGGVYSANSFNLTLFDASFEFNQALGSNTGKGGAIGLLGDANFSLSLSNVTFDSNYAWYGGAIFLPYYSKISVSNSYMVSNRAIYTGGGVFMDKFSSGIIANSSATNNSAGENGGFINMGDFSFLTFEKSIIRANMANEIGGGMCAEGMAKLDFISSIAM